MRSQASRICSACAVSMTSEEVRPKCSQRADGPTCSATAVVKAMTSCWVTCLDFLDAGDVEGAALPDVARGLGRDDARARHRVGGGDLDLQPRFVSALVAPDATHLGVGVARNHLDETRRLLAPPVC